MFVDLFINAAKQITILVKMKKGIQKKDPVKPTKPKPKVSPTDHLKPPTKDDSRPRQEEESKPRTLKEETKTLDILNTLMLQYAYSVHLLNTSIEKQSTEAESELQDRCKQLIDLKKQVNSLKLDSESRTKTTLLDDVLSMEYSSLKNIEEDILISTEYIKELKNNSTEYLNRVDLDKGVIISPKDLENSLEKTALELNSLVAIVENDYESVESLANDFKQVVHIVQAQHEFLEKIKESKKLVDHQKTQEKIETVQKILPIRETFINTLITENF